ncbi:MAG: efflux transporter outer membrane subunit [Elusimicrobiaceae bacterium]|nr:efflux transporter outer membrane subunit [Elusimicrobiaceae bacterium]
MRLFNLLVACAMLGAGCTMGPNYKRPDADLPQGADASNYSVFTQQNWWTMFGDDVLNQMEDIALKYNWDLQAAIARVDQARAEVTIAGANQLPTLSAVGTTGRQGNAQGSGESTSRVGLTASFELDLWGKYRRMKESARAQLLATEAARDTVKLALTADVAKQYFTMLMLDHQIEIAQQTVAARQENVRIYQSRYEAGYATEVDLRRVQANMQSVKADEDNLRLQLSKTETALAVLLGKSPRAIVEEKMTRGKKLNEVTLVPDVPADLPSDLLERRPDVMTAEENLIAANANIGVARASYFPDISLTAAAGYASSALTSLFTGGSGVWSLGADLVSPIFNAGKITAENKKAEAQYREILANYQKTLQLAFKEALDAINSNQRYRQIYDSYLAQTNDMRRSYELTKKQEDAGLIGVTDLLSVEETLLSSEMNLSTARKNELDAVVDLAKALGGGWTAQDIEEAKKK